jgi:hypothetical protein
VSFPELACRLARSSLGPLKVAALAALLSILKLDIAEPTRKTGQNLLRGQRPLQDLAQDGQ